MTVGGYLGQMSKQAEHFADRKSHEASILPVFEGGRNVANFQLARARRDEAAAVDLARALGGVPAQCFREPPEA